MFTKFNNFVLSCSRVKGVEFALKIIDKSKCAGKEHMIENEVSILRSVQHPNIIRLVAEHDTPSELYLVMELVKVISCYTYHSCSICPHNRK